MYLPTTLRCSLPSLLFAVLPLATTARLLTAMQFRRRNSQLPEQLHHRSERRPAAGDSPRKQHLCEHGLVQSRAYPNLYSSWPTVTSARITDENSLQRKITCVLVPCTAHRPHTELELVGDATVIYAALVQRQPLYF